MQEAKPSPQMCVCLPILSHLDFSHMSQRPVYGQGSDGDERLGGRAVGMSTYAGHPQPAAGLRHSSPFKKSETALETET